MKNKYTPIINHFSALVKAESLSDNSTEFQEAIDKFIALLNLHVVKKIDHSFEPIGKTFIYVLSESHLAIHTWPEYNLFHLDLVTCSELEKETVKNAMSESFTMLGINDLVLIQSEI